MHAIDVSERPSSPSQQDSGVERRHVPPVPLPRVLAVVPGIPDGPGFIFSKRQVLALQRLGVPVATFFVPSRQSPVALLQAWWRLRREVRAFRPDVVHAHFGTMTGFICAVGTSKPLVITYRGSDLNPVPSISQVRALAGKLLSQLAAVRATRIICVSGQLRDRLWWRKRRATIITNGVDTEQFHPRPRSEARAELGWRADERVVLFNGGRFPRVKRLDLAEAGVEAARTLCGPIRLRVLDGHTAGDQVPTLMNAADVLVVTSDWEGSPDIVKEALACNLPVVSVDVGDVAERLRGVQPSRIVERDPAALGGALADVLASGERSNGRETIAELATRHVAERILHELQAAAKGGAGAEG